MQLILAILVSVIFFSGYLLFDKIRLDKKRKDSLRARITPDGMATNFDEMPISLNSEPSPNAKAVMKLLKALGINVDASSRKLEKWFAQAGIRSPDAAVHYLFFERVGSIIFAVVATGLVISANNDNKLKMYTIALFLFVIGFFGPKLYIQNKIDHRKKILFKSFPDTLDLLLICVESGLALDAALNRVCAELGRAHPEMTEELNRTRLELALLNDRVRALMNLADRTDLGAMRSLVSALIQSEKFGTSLTDTLRVLSEEFRLTRLSMAEAKAARLPALITVPLMVLLMPALFIVILGPAILGMMEQM